MKTTNENRSGAAPSAPEDVAECVRCGARVSVLDAITIYNDPYCAKCAEAALGEMERKEESETLADIVAALRHNSKGLMFYLRENENGSTHAMGADYADLADRIEAAARRELKACKEAVLDFCDVFTLVYPPNDGDCPAVLAGAFELLKDAMGIETIETGKGDNNGSK